MNEQILAQKANLNPSIEYKDEQRRLQALDYATRIMTSVRIVETGDILECARRIEKYLCGEEPK